MSILVWLGTALAIFLPFALISLLALVSPTPRPVYASENTYRSLDSLDALQPIAKEDLVHSALSITLIVPAYNEALRLPAMLKEALSHLEARKMRLEAREEVGDYEVLVVDDGSTDNTADVALELCKELRGKGGDCVRVVRLEKNRGKGGAVVHGMNLSRGERILFADADGASKFSDLDKLEAALDQHTTSSGHGMALGSRAHLVDTAAVVQRSAIRNLLMRSFHLYLHVLVGDLLKDTQCGFKLFTFKSARLLAPRMHCEHWIFDIELLLLAKYARIPMKEINITWTEVEGSKMNLIHDSLQMAVDLLIIRANYALRRWKAPPAVK